MLRLGLKRNLKLGFKNLARHLTRSILTMLGIVFGVAAVVAMLAIGEGASYESQERIKSLGSQNIIIKSVQPPEETKARPPSHGIASAIYGLTYADAERMQATLPGIDVVMPIRETRQDIWNRDRKIDGLVRAAVPWYLQVTGQRLHGGRFISHVDMHARAAVCVIGSAVKRKLFPYENPLGRIIKIGKDYYRVVGVMQPILSGAGEAGLVTDNNAEVYIPFTTARARFGKTILKVSAGSFEAETVELHLIFVKVTDMERVLPLAEMIETLLARYHPRRDYEIIIPLKLLEEIRRSARMFSIVLGMIAAISLLVGGIGIMNIMLANVTERTREIGIRRALGAGKRDITIQFLSETVVLSVVGGVLGLGLGVTLPLLIALFTGLKVLFTAWSLLLSFGISAAVGLVFGIYPAWRAANLDPIQALRHV